MARHLRHQTTLFWGKAQAQVTSAFPMHSLVAHALDVAAVATLLQRPRSMNMPGQMLGFLAAIHDIGKFSRSFQAKDMAHWPQAALGPPPAAVPSGARHDALGLYLLRKPLARLLDTALPPQQEGQSCSLHARGCPAEGGRARRAHHVFPACAGMSRARDARPR